MLQAYVAPGRFGLSSLGWISKVSIFKKSQEDSNVQSVLTTAKLEEVIRTGIKSEQALNILVNIWNYSSEGDSGNASCRWFLHMSSLS